VDLVGAHLYILYRDTDSLRNHSRELPLRAVQRCQKGRSGRSADLVGDDIVGGVDEGLFVAGRDGRAGGDVVSAAVAAD